MINGMCAVCYRRYRAMLTTLLTAEEAVIEASMHESCAHSAARFFAFIGAKNE